MQKQQGFMFKIASNIFWMTIILLIVVFLPMLFWKIFDMNLCHGNYKYFVVECAHVEDSQRKEE